MKLRRDYLLPLLRPVRCWERGTGPVTKEMLNRRADVVVLILKGGYNNVKPELWITAYPVPFESKELVLIVAK